MHIKEARNITRNFIRNGNEFTPVLASDWKMSFDRILTIYSDIEQTSFSIRSDNLIKEYLLNSNFNVKNDLIIGNYYHTSVGLVSEDDFYLAETTIEQNLIKFKKEDLEIGKNYLSDKGVSYLYLGILEVKVIELCDSLLEKDFLKTPELLWDIRNKKCIKLSSIKIIKEFEQILNFDLEIKEEYLSLLFNIDLDAFEYVSFRDISNNVFLVDLNKDNLLSKIDYFHSLSLEEIEEVEEFIMSTEKKKILQKDEEKVNEHNKRQERRYMYESSRDLGLFRN